MLIRGVVREMRRVRVYPPSDGVHRASNADGYLKGCRSAVLNDSTLLPRGMTGFYYWYKPNRGVKIYYSMHHNRCCSVRTVRRQFRKHQSLHAIGVATRPHKIVRVELSYDYYGKGGDFVRHVRAKAYGIVTTHAHYPMNAWYKYAQGYPYDWNAYDHPDHSPKGYRRWVKWLKSKLEKARIYVCGDYPKKEEQPPKLGDAIFCTKTNRWWLVDVG